MKITLKSYTLTGLTIGRYRVRQGKAGPNGKPKTDMMLLARATPVYEMGHVSHLKKHEGFNKFNNRMVPDSEANSTKLKWTHEGKLTPVKILDKLEMSCELTEDVFDTINKLFRSVLVFKGLGPIQIAEDLAKNEGKEVTYSPKVVIDIMLSEDAVSNLSLRCGKITVRKVFPDGGILFSSKSCKGMKIALQTIGFDKYLKLHS